VPHILFTEQLFGEGIAIKSSVHKELTPFAGIMMQFPEQANQLKIKAGNGLKLQI
jgi:phosphotransferase system IIA component